jgi:hypothetical protein
MVGLVVVRTGEAAEVCSEGAVAVVCGVVADEEV